MQKNLSMTVLFSLLMLWVASVQGQIRLTEEVALARLCISEAGWDCFNRGDGLAIHEVISRGAAHAGMHYTSYARAYAGRLFGARPHDVARLHWVGELTPGCTRPAHWPETVTERAGGATVVRPHPAWEGYRERCLTVMARAAEIVAAMPAADVESWSICERAVHDWGGIADEARAHRLGLVPVMCGLSEEGTRNTFYCRPSLDPLCAEIDRD